MSITALALVAPGDIITSAQQNIVRSNFTSIDARTGGDPGVTGRLLRSDGATSAAWVAALTVVLDALGYTPLKNTTDALTGNLTVTGAISAEDLALSDDFTMSGDAVVGGSMVAGGGINGGNYDGGSLSQGTPDFLGIGVGSTGIASSGAIVGSSTIQSGAWAGGSTAAGELNALVVNAGGSGITSTGPIVGSSTVQSGAWAGGSVLSGALNALAINAGTTGIASAGPITAPGATFSDDVSVTGANSLFIQGQEAYWPGNPPPLGSGAAVPSGLVAMFRTAAAIASGWTRETALDGRMPVGAGTTFTVTFTEATDYGASWSHTHTDSGHTHGASALGVGGQTGSSPSTLNGRFTAGGANTLPDNHVHDSGTLDVTGSTDSDTASITSTAWTIPSRAYVFAIKT